MKVFELMYERQNPPIPDAGQIHWLRAGGLWGWLARLFHRNGDHADYMRKF